MIFVGVYAGVTAEIGTLSVEYDTTHVEAGTRYIRYLSGLGSTTVSIEEVIMLVCSVTE